jgi:hypothetical protein
MLVTTGPAEQVGALPDAVDGSAEPPTWANVAGGASAKLEVRLGQHPTPQQPGIALPGQNPVRNLPGQGFSRQPGLGAGLGVEVPKFGFRARLTRKWHGQLSVFDCNQVSVFDCNKGISKCIRVEGASLGSGSVWSETEQRSPRWFPDIPTEDVQIPVEK